MVQKFTQPDDYGLWRFGIISPLLHRTEDAPALCTQIQELAGRVFYTPAGAEKRLCAATIRDWLNRYRAHGIDGLRNKPRKDHGSSSVSAGLELALTDVRKSHPAWTVKRLLKELLNQGVWNQNTIFIGDDKRPLKPVDTVKNALRFDKPLRGMFDTNNNKEKNQ